jgi:hypothetical protein
VQPGRYCALNGIAEEGDLVAGLDFRRPEYRREVFLRFYDFHLRHRAHPGAVYYVIPELRRRLGWTDEQAYWFAFINGNTQNPVTSYIIWSKFPDIATLNPRYLRDFCSNEWKRLDWDTDRRYWKAHFISAVEKYIALLNGRNQAEFFDQFNRADELYGFDKLWKIVREKFYGFGRLSAWSYIEYLRIIGLGVQPRELFLRDIPGSKSHRNGLCKVLGRDDMDWREGDSPFTDEILAWLEREAMLLLLEAQDRALETAHYRDANFLTLESTLCCYKSWHRPNRRYPNVYNDMLHDRIKRAEASWRTNLSVFWDIRRRCLPEYLRLEDNLGDVGLKPEKQNHYLLTGEVILMDRDWPCFANHYSQPATGARLL